MVSSPSLAKVLPLALMMGAALLASAGAAAQTGAEPGATADSLSTPATAMAISEIPRGLDTSHQFLNDILGDLESSSADTTISSGLQSTAAEIEDLTDQVALLDPERASSRALRDLEGACLRQVTRLENWARTLEHRAAELDVRREELKSSLESWQFTRDGLVQDEVGEGLLSEIDSLLTRHQTVTGRLDTHYTNVLSLRTRISEQVQRLTTSLGILGGLGRERLWSLVQPESPPIWSVKDESGQTGGLGAKIGSAWRDAISPIGPFLKEQNSRLVVQALVFIGLLAGILIARSRTGSGPKADPDTELPAIFARPASAAFIATLVLDRVFHVPAPETFIVLVRAVSVLPLLRLAPRMLPERYVGPITFIALLYLLDSGEFLFVADAPLHRAHLLAVSLLGLGAAIVFIARERREPDGGASQLRLGFMAIIGLLFAVGCITNVYGAVELARVVTNDLLSAFYIVLVVIIAVRGVEDVTGIALSHAPFQKLRSVRRHQAMLQRRANLVVRAGIIVLGARAMLGSLGLERALVDGFLALMKAGGTVGALTLTVGDFFAFFFTLWVAFQVSRYLQFALGEDILPGISLPRGMNQTIVRLTHYAVVTLGFMLAVAASGMDVSKLAILAGGLGVGLGFGLQSIVNNFISGLILMFERPIQVGDTIEVGTLIGRVKSIGIRASTVRTYSGAEVVVPNANLVASEVVNWTLSDRLRRIELPLGVAYGSDPEQVSEILLAAAAGHEDALTRPEPLAVFLGFGESALEFELRFWTREFDEWQRIRGQVATQVQRSMAEAEIEIPFPQRTVHLKSDARLPDAPGGD